MITPTHASGVSREWALIYAVIQGGHDAFRIAKKAGIEAHHLGESTTDENRIWQLFESFRLSKSMPSPIDIHHALSITVAPAPTGVSFDAELYSELVRDWNLYQDLSARLGPVVARLEDNPLAKRDLIKEIIRDTAWVTGAKHADRTNNPQSFKDVREAYERVKDARLHGKILGLPSPWPLWDRRSLGVEDGKLMIILAKRTGGKTMLALAWANHLWQKHLKANENILFVSMEMDPLAIKQRLFSIRERLDYSKFRAGALTGMEEGRFYKFLDDYENHPDPGEAEIIFAYSDQVRTVEDIAALAQEYKSKAVFIDGLYILKGEGSSTWERVTNVAKDCKLLLANELHIPVFATSQFKGAHGQDEDKADADDAGYSKAIGDYADMMLGVMASEELKKDRQRIIRCLKGREFEPIHWRINFDMTLMNFTEIGEET